ncbi:MAG: nucleotidyltransferase substrate binding protein [Peptococcia bacterium]|jgi:nucleotidyltransferase substrate binding protein (TIGR01987 family)
MSNNQQKLQNYQKAIQRLREGINKYNGQDDLSRDGLIQRFEFTFELAWKTLKTVFEAEGLLGLNSPKTVLREAYAAELINDDDTWLKMLNDRNTTAHIYSEDLAKEICQNIKEKYVYELTKLAEKIELRLNKLGQ